MADTGTQQSLAGAVHPPADSCAVGVKPVDAADDSVVSLTPSDTVDIAIDSPAMSPHSGEATSPTPATPESQQEAAIAPPTKGHGLGEITAPDMSLWQLFVLFLGFGLRAWGGPVAQIAALKQSLVVEKKWITVARFNRVLAVYQVLPGPEATEMCCYFGMIARGRLGATIAGVAFLLPGFLMMLLSAWLYNTFGRQSAIFTAALGTLQPAVCAMVFRAVHKIGEHALQDAATHEFDVSLGIAAGLAALESVMNVNFFVTLVHCGVLHGVFFSRKWWIAGALWLLGPLAAFFAIIAIRGSFGDAIPKGVGAGNLGRTPAAMFVVGLVGGVLTFGGAYTAIPIMQYEAVTVGNWLSNTQFLDGLAIGSVLPSPLVIFSTFVGFLSDGIGGAVLMTLGMFLPAFMFTLIGHDFFERIVETKGVIAQILDGVSAAVVGLIAVTAVQLLKSAVVRPVDAVVFALSLAALYNGKHRLTPVAVVAAAALAGFVLA